MAAAAFLSLFAFFGRAQADVFLKKDFSSDLVEELQRYTPAATTSSLDRFEAILSPMHGSLPKNDDDLLEFNLVRYALHRMLVQQHGWYVKGVEPDGKQWNASSLGVAVRNWMSSSLASTVEEWVPAHIENAVHERMGAGGLTLRELAAVGSLLETAARREAARRVDDVYALYGLDPSEPLRGQDSIKALDTYMYIYLDPLDFHPRSGHEAWMRIRRFQHKDGSEWPSMSKWLYSLQNNVSAVDEDHDLDYPGMLKVAEEVGKQYFHFDVRECHNLKAALMNLEGERAGRVPLRDFYRTGMTGDNFFKFNEKKEYLRDLGALDESDPLKPSVIIPNYVTSAPQCLQASKLYAVCCRSECEDLLAQLEAKSGESAVAAPADVIDVVEALSSETVQAPRKLSASLIEKLHQVAEVNGGQVPLHGRLFSQWMHHAFPRECPFPHETGTTSPMAADDWLKATGHASAEATEEEMVCHVSGPCSGSAAAAAGSSDDEGSPADGGPSDAPTELPWILKEELLTRKNLEKAGFVCLRTAAQLGALLSMVGVSLASILRTLHTAALANSGGQDGKPLRASSAETACSLDMDAAVLL
eukprot:TRINITY_DN76754_c0_g1_i1.p1 TRINITY_DN76754_c0_g1~~TRINITY_DN76754_c0_g1_i1.p1  ORF type:complete len:610 (+),score=169.39 TRINITY_DN76754_c0_g1_i1:69-1832(+)